MAAAGVLDEPAFEAGGRRFTWGDVRDAARAWGEWDRARRRAEALVAADLAHGNADPQPDGLRDAQRDWRHEHGLLSAEELEDWLARHGIELGEWRASLRRSLLEGQAPPPGAPVAGAAVGPGDGEHDRPAWVDAVVRGEARRWADRLAEGIAVHLAQGADYSGAPEAVPDPAAIEEGRQRFCEAQATAAAVAKELEAHLVEWTQLELRWLRHSDPGPVREAALCVREDGRELAEVAEQAGLPLREWAGVLDELPGSLALAVAPAREGELIGPVGGEHEWHLIQILGRRPPAPEDPVTRARAQSAVGARALTRLVEATIRWHDHR